MSVTAIFRQLTIASELPTSCRLDQRGPSECPLLGTEPTDPATFAGMILLLAAVSFLGVLSAKLRKVA